MTKRRLKQPVTPGFRQLQRQVRAIHNLAEDWIKNGRTEEIKISGKIIKLVLIAAKNGNRSLYSYLWNDSTTNDSCRVLPETINVSLISPDDMNNRKKIITDGKFEKNYNGKIEVKEDENVEIDIPQIPDQ